MTNKKLKIGIVGGTGYTGVELLRLLSIHPNAELTAITSRGEAGLPVADMFPSLRRFVDLKFTDPAQSNLAECDVVFFATPHGVAMSQAQALLDANVKVIDLAADFRLQDTTILKNGTKCRIAALIYLNKRFMVFRSYIVSRLNQRKLLGTLDATQPQYC